MKNLLAAAVLVLAPYASYAAEDGQLWEVTTQMELPDDMPAAMAGAMGGKRTAKFCRGEDPRDAITKDKDMKDCEIKDLKQTSTTVSMTAVCKKGRTAKMEIIYNKARTEYKGTMLVSDGGDVMTMRSTGKNLGPCDAKKAKAEQTAAIDKYKAQGEEAQAQYKAMLKKTEKDQLKACTKGLDTMNPEQFGIFGMCRNKKDKDCKSALSDYSKQYPKAAEECSAKTDAFCEAYETQEGFQKVGRDAGKLRVAGEMCGVSPDKLRKKLCKAASKAESYEFIGGNCPDQAKPLAKKHCAGRSYTVKEGDPRRVDKQWFKFCVAVAGAHSEGDDGAADEQPTPKSEKEKAKAEAKKAAKGAAVEAFKGLFK